MAFDNHKVHIWRGNQSGSFQTYEVPRQELQTVLDLVTYIQRQLDNSLAYRFACRVGVCGTCAMMVNGQPRWTCRTQASMVHATGGITLAPLENFPIVRDLVVDMDPFFDKWMQANAEFKNSSNENRTKFAIVNPKSAMRIQVDQSIECIGCGVCYAACDVVKWKPDYLGPAALNRTWSLINDERNPEQTDVLKAVSPESGCISCHTTQSCTQYCPKELNPSASIAGLKRRLFSRGIFRDKRQSA